MAVEKLKIGKEPKKTMDINARVQNLGTFEKTELTDVETLYLREENASYPLIPVEGKGYYVVTSTSYGNRKVSYLCHVAEWFEIKKITYGKDNKRTVTIDVRGRSIGVPHETFMPSEIGTLSRYIRISTENLKVTSKGFSKLLYSYDIMPENRIIGFYADGTNNPAFDAYSSENPVLIYSENTNLEEYTKGLNKLLTNAGMMFALSCACASMFLAFLRIFCNVPLSSFVLSFVGKTSTGKSTVQTLMASVYTKPSDEKVMRSFYGTENALIKLLDNKMGVPMIFDETTITSKTDIGRMIYAISLGSGKARCTTNADIKQSGEWYTIVSTSSEASNLSTQKMHNGGLDARNLEFEDLSFTDSAEHAESVKSFSNENYGLLGRELSGYLVSSTPDKIKQVYDSCKQQVSEAIGNDNYFDLSERLISNYALIITAATVLANFGVNVSVESVTDIVVNHHTDISGKYNIADNFYDHIIDFIAAHPCVSYIQPVKDKTNVRAIIATEFESILSDYGASNIKLVLNKLEESGYLIRGKGEKLTEEAKSKGLKSNTTLKARRRFNGVLTDCYLVKLPDEDESVESDTSGIAHSLENYEEVIK